MDDFNLIPASYRRRRRLKRWLLAFSGFYVLVVLAIGTGKVAISDFIESARSEIDLLKGDTQEVLSRKRELREMRDRESELEHRLIVLDRLIDGPRITRLFQAIDRSLDERIWFVDWKFVRAGELVDVPEKTVERGYFIVVSEPSTTGLQQAWKILTHMEISARAVNHSALAEFVRRLGVQPEVDGVQVVATQTEQFDGQNVIGFRLAVLLDTLEGSPG